MYSSALTSIPFICFFGITVYEHTLFLLLPRTSLVHNRRKREKTTMKRSKHDAQQEQFSAIQFIVPVALTAEEGNKEENKTEIYQVTKESIVFLVSKKFNLLFQFQRNH
jgi:hypothetical protein